MTFSLNLQKMYLFVVDEQQIYTQKDYLSLLPHNWLLSTSVHSLCFRRVPAPSLSWLWRDLFLFHHCSRNTFGLTFFFQLIPNQLLYHTLLIHILDFFHSLSLQTSSDRSVSLSHKLLLVASYVPRSLLLLHAYYSDHLFSFNHTSSLLLRRRVPITLFHCFYSCSIPSSDFVWFFSNRSIISFSSVF